MAHHHSHDSGKNLRLAFFLNLSFTLIELVGGWYVNSVAIISDAVHDLGDSISLGTSWYLDKLSKKKATESYSFGYRRFSLLGALINAIVLILGSVFVIREAILRLQSPEMSDAKGMFYFALLGVAVNGYAAWKLSKGKTLNERVITWHLIEDVLGWIAVLIASIILLFYPNPYLDPALSLLIAAFILWNVIKRLRETVFIFLQGQPLDVDKSAIEKEIRAIVHVDSTHHTHIWSLDGEHHVFTSHVKLKPLQSMEDILHVKNELKRIMKKYPFEHYTIETEFEGEDCVLLREEKNDHS
ncbi:cation diffusion facilitator family transporter [Algoriphagus sp.]|jgi:cobalt-zinc-cadmium efflux system protein|uniref:cation diffusion facilitator family transporter n=1 Tax=Algoriphagus sp. TaxID=1872435 RepID=UPI0027272C23|nr:cation diffusion facilitator family transporter [Algoriphagus sp.]MDO8966593.1 cation diffusion facilitator family transporter [Algoriphagus sp.]MDP3202039.1 cation diffusion facilitator family transporter [Algoriphagus sp.]